MGRSPCCEKLGLKKGPWTAEEDQKLLAYIEEHGHGSWRALPAKAGLQRCGKSCRLRWTNYLRPDIKRGKFSLQEEQTIIQLHALLGNRWSAIATHLPKRTDNEIKNYWNTHLKKRLAKMGIDPVTHKPKSDALSSADGHTKNAASLSHMAQWESARLEAEARLARESKLRSAAAAVAAASSTKSTAGGEHHFQLPAHSPGDRLQPSCAPSAACLDVLRAWQGGGVSKRGGAPQVGGIDLESPTSTLSFSETGMPHSVTSSSLGLTPAVSRHGGRGEEEVEESEWKCFGRPGMRTAADAKEKVDSFGGFPMEPSIFAPDASWLHEPAKHGPGSGHFGDGLMTEMLLENSNSSSESGGVGDSGNADSCGGDGGGEHENEEENKSYWNSILNLVNSGSPSGSPSLF